MTTVASLRVPVTWVAPHLSHCLWRRGTPPVPRLVTRGALHLSMAFAGTPGFYIAQPGAADGFTFSNNTVDDGSKVRLSGQSLLPSLPACNLTRLDAPLQGSASVTVVLPPNVTRVGGGPGIVLSATAQTPGSVLRYSVDGSRPTPASPLWPGGSGGTLSLPARTAAVFVKAFPAGAGSAGSSRQWRAQEEGGGVVVESPVGGGVYASQS